MQSKLIKIIMKLNLIIVCAKVSNVKAAGSSVNNSKRRLLQLCLQFGLYIFYNIFTNTYVAVGHMLIVDLGTTYWQWLNNFTSYMSPEIMSLSGQSVTASRGFLIAGQIRGLQYASEPHPGSNKCLGNQKCILQQRKKCDCSVLRLKDITLST